MCFWVTSICAEPASEVHHQNQQQGKTELILPELPGESIAPNAAVLNPMRQSTSLPGSIQQQSAWRGVRLDEAKSIALPLPVNALGQGEANKTSATLSARKFSWQQQTENTYSQLGIGGAAYDNRFRLSTALNLAYALSEQTSIGGNLQFSPKRSEVVINAVHQWPFGLRFKGSYAYMWGTQEFSFPSGKAEVDLAQQAYAVEVKYRAQDWFNTLQSLGISAWGAAAMQRSGDQETYFMKQTGASYDVFLDSRKLAVGRLHGQSLDAQITLFSNLVLQASFGREQLTFPFSDGTKERTEKPFLDLKLHYEPVPDWLLSTHYQNGTSGQQFGLTMQHLPWKLSLVRQRGSNGLRGSDSVMLSYDLMFGKNRSTQTLAERMLPSAQNNKIALLNDAATRPSTMPQNFLAKVDPTASKVVMSVCKDASLRGATLSPSGQFTIEVGSGPIYIDRVLRNGEIFSDGDLFVGGDSHFSLNTKKLPRALVTDIYTITVSDGLDRYEILADASLTKSMVCP